MLKQAYFFALIAWDLSYAIAGFHPRSVVDRSMTMEERHREDAAFDIQGRAGNVMAWSTFEIAFAQIVPGPGVIGAP